MACLKALLDVLKSFLKNQYNKVKAHKSINLQYIKQAAQSQSLKENWRGTEESNSSL